MSARKGKRTGRSGSEQNKDGKRNQARKSRNKDGGERIVGKARADNDLGI